MTDLSNGVASAGTAATGSADDSSMPELNIGSTDTSGMSTHLDQILQTTKQVQETQLIYNMKAALLKAQFDVMQNMIQKMT